MFYFLSKCHVKLQNSMGTLVHGVFAMRHDCTRILPSSPVLRIFGQKKLTMHFVLDFFSTYSPTNFVCSRRIAYWDKNLEKMEKLRIFAI